MSIFSSSQGASRKSVTRPHSSAGRGHTPTSSRAKAPSSEAATEGRFASALMSALFALPVTAIIGLILLLIAAAVAYTNPDPDLLTTPLGLGALGLTACLGGLVAARREPSRPLLSGLLSGLLLALVLVILSLLFGDEARARLTTGFPPAVLWGLHGAVVLLALLGAKLGSRRPSQVRHGHQKRK